MNNEMKNYFGRFNDHTPPKWKTELIDSQWAITLPNGQKITIHQDHPAIDWITPPHTDPGSTRLWINSLRYIPEILKKEDISTTEAIITSFLGYSAQLAGNPDQFKSGSLDHQCALQLRTLCDIKSWLAGSRPSTGEEFEVLNKYLSQCIQNIYTIVENLELLKPNNHGIMLAVSISHSAFIFPHIECPAGSQDGIQAFLLKAFADIFGNDGFANENTPGYQKLYLDLLAGLISFLQWAKIPFSPQIFNIHRQAVDAFRSTLLPNQHVPPIGDYCYQSQEQYKAKSGLWFSEENGILINSNEESYISFICGSRGIFHKQMDDTSITLFHRGRYLIQDAGLASYNHDDPVAVSVRSQSGHSGLFFKEFDSVHPGDVISYGKNSRTIQATLTVQNNNTATSPTIAVGNVSFRMTTSRRCIELINEYSFFIHDSVVGNENAVTPVSRFLLDPDAKIEFNNKGFHVSNGSSWVFIEPVTKNLSYSSYRGTTFPGDSARGFLARRNYKVQTTTVLDISIPLDDTFSGQQSYRVSFGSD